MRLIYLAGPYTHKDPDQMEARVDQHVACLAYFCNCAQNLCIYSPIVHWHQVAKKHSLPYNFNFWMQQDFHMIKQSTAMWVLTLEGWQESYGLSQELEYAESINRSILYVNVDPKGYILTDDATVDALPLQI